MPDEEEPDTEEEPEEADEQQVGWFDRVLMDPLDHLQRRIKPAAFTVALLKRFSEDRGSQYSTLLAYYGFFSLLAILLVIGTISATLLANSPERQQTLTEAITKAIPVTGDTVAQNVQRLSGSGVALLVGVLIVMWSGLGVVNNAQDAFNTMWSVPRYHWPSIWSRIGRSAAVLGVAGIALLALTAGGPILSALELGGFQLVLAGVAAAAINAGALVICLELLTRKRVGMKALLPGAIVGGIALVILQFAGTWYMTRVVARAGAFYGTFAAAIGVLVWIGLQARLILISNEINVVRSKHLWPRSMTGRNLTEADQRALTDMVEREALFEGAVIAAQLGESD